MMAKPISASAWLLAVSTMPQLTSGFVSPLLMTTTRPATQSSVQMQYGGYDAQYGNAPQFGYDQQQGQQQQQQQLVWCLAGTEGVTGFSGIAGFKGAHASRHFEMDYRYLPYALKPGEDQVLSRWNMVKQKLTVSRIQCKVDALFDGSATLTSEGRGPTMWKPNGESQWYRLQRGDCAPLSPGDQVALDWHNPESAVFTAYQDLLRQDVGEVQRQQEQQRQEQSARNLFEQLQQQGINNQQQYGQQGMQQQQQYGQQQHGQQQQQGYEQQPQLPAGWTMLIDQDSNTPYYRNDQTGECQWEMPQGGY